MDRSRRRTILDSRLSIAWPGEPILGSIYGDDEVAAATQAIRSSMDYTRGFGFICPEIDGFEAAFARFCGTTHGVSVNGAGTGLDMAMMCLDLEPGDEVICPSINFRSGPMAIIGQGGKWVPCEVDPVTLEADPEDVERRITTRTRAVLPVDMNGGPADRDELAAVAGRHPHPRHGPIRLIYDAARACGATYRGRRVGKDGWMTVFSFHTQKLMSTLGEGGAVCTDEPDLDRRLREIRQFGGEDGWGTNYKLTKVQAAVGLVQLPKLDGFIAARRRLAARRDELLRDREELTLPTVAPGGGHTYYLYTLLVPPDWAGKRRDMLLELLRSRFGVQSVIANPPCHIVHPFLRRHTEGVRLPVSEELGARLFCLPIHPAMSDEDNEYIAAALCQALDDVRREPEFSRT